MKKIYTILIMLIISAGILSAQTPIPGLLSPVDPAILGRGNTAVAEPGAYQAFFTNPAGFALENMFTVLSLNPWLFSDKNTIDLLRDPNGTVDDIEATLADEDVQAEIQNWIDSQTPEELLAILQEAGVDVTTTEEAEAWFEGDLTVDQYLEIAPVVLEDDDFPVSEDELGLPSGSARAGVSAGIAFTHKGFAIGLFALVDAQLEGPNIFDTTGTATVQATMHVGYAHSFDFGFMKLHAGAQIRPTMIFRTVVTSQFLDNIISSGGDVYEQLLEQPGVAGFGIGLDAGIIAEIWWFKVGISAMNLLSVMNWDDTVTLGDLAGNFSSMFPSENQIADPETNIKLNFGLSFHPVIPVITKLLDPALYVDFQDLNGIIEAYNDGDEEALLDLVNIGLDVKLISILRAKVGYSSGYFTAGVALDIPVINISVATTFGTLEADDISDFGIAAEIAIRL
ncbi:MAG: hypothetical protein JW874_07250 [Spirochaetales bacterium]|nr:hypothetical protein [Spirochaetales bacterium]